VKNTKTDEDKNGIHLATVSGAYNNLHIIALLADCGVDLNAVTKNERRTPLMLACVLGNDDAVKSLLRLGADHTLLDYEQNTALHLACIYNHDRIVKELLDHGSSLLVKNKFNLTPVQCIKNV
jgi:ankyrin repeat protein